LPNLRNRLQQAPLRLLFRLLLSQWWSTLMFLRLQKCARSHRTRFPTSPTDCRSRWRYRPKMSLAVRFTEWTTEEDDPFLVWVCGWICRS